MSGKTGALLSILITSLLGILIAPSAEALFQPSGFQGRAFERLADGTIGSTLDGVKISWVSEDGTFSAVAVTDASGSYQVSLPPDRYVVTAKKQGFEDYSSAPGFWVVVGPGFQTGNIFLSRPDRGNPF